MGADGVGGLGLGAVKSSHLLGLGWGWRCAWGRVFGSLGSDPSFLFLFLI